MRTKIYKTISSCFDCGFLSLSAKYCRHESIKNEDKEIKQIHDGIPEFCPLQDAPEKNVGLISLVEATQEVLILSFEDACNYLIASLITLKSSKIAPEKTEEKLVEAKVNP